MFGQVLAVIIFSLSYVLRCEAQVNTFQWKWGNNFVLTDLQECQTLPIIVESLNASDPSSVGVAPYYLIAFKPGGIPTTTPIGSNVAQLSWTVNHARGSELLLTIVDSVGNVGGIPNTFYNVTAGNNQSCIPAQLSTPTIASIQPNVTDVLMTCQPWGLTITGGTKPYQIVLAAPGSTVITNVTMGAADDVFTYPNRADPNGVLMVSVYDGAGHWGVSPDVVHTQGSTNVLCTGEVSSSKTTQEIQQEAKDRDAAARAAARHHRTTVILGAVLGTILPLIAIALGVFFFLRRRKLLRDINRGVWDGQDTVPRAYSPTAGSDGEVLSSPQTQGPVRNDYMREVGVTSITSRGATSLDSKSGYHTQDSSSFSPLLHSTTQSPTDSLTGDSSNHPSIQGTYAGSTTTSPNSPSSRSVPWSRKRLEAHSELIPSPANFSISHTSSFNSLRALSGPSGTSSGPTSPPRSLTQLPAGALPPLTPGSSTLDPDVQPDIIIQHRDGGSRGVVQELPPPYADRYSRIASAAGPSSSSTSAAAVVPPSPPPPVPAKDVDENNVAKPHTTTDPEES
ncbi:hypothetical protein ABKN59_007149 [Abortiporus biennis]